ncbi:hypothetical protein SDC9_129116 [bioreactor metagenome]|uniref:Uncharacterized protein n=1 Tax=bioreactor metagenome TaxID=1076179 RepID=A0A645CYX7_9ZZZZ
MYIQKHGRRIFELRVEQGNFFFIAARFPDCGSADDGFRKSRCRFGDVHGVARIQIWQVAHHVGMEGMAQLMG